MRAASGRSVARALLALALIALGLYALLFFVHGWALVGFRYEADYGEGPLLNQVHLLLRGVDIYHNDSAPPYIVANYPPVYIVAAALLSRLGMGPGFTAGRALSTVAVGVAALLAGLCVRTCLRRSTVDGMGSAAGAALTFGLILAQNYIWQWGPLHRVDSLALCWQMAGLYAVARRPEAADRAWPWFVLAVFTRQSSVEALIATVWTLWPRHRPVAVRLCVRVAAAVALGVASLQLATHGQFLVHTVLYNANRWGWGGVAGAAGSWLFVAGGLPVIGWAVWGWRRGEGADSAELIRRFAVVAWVGALTVGKVGSSLNYFFPSIAGAAMLAGLGAPVAARRIWPAALLLVYVVGVPPLADAHGVAGDVVRSLSAYHDLGTPSFDRLGWDTPASGRDPDQARLTALLARTPGPILSENMGDLVLSGHQVYFQPFELTQVHNDGHWDDRPLLAAVGRGDFPLIVLGFPLEQPSHWHTDRWPPEVLRAMVARYAPAGTLGRFHLYKPV